MTCYLRRNFQRNVHGFQSGKAGTWRQEGVGGKVLSANSGQSLNPENQILWIFFGLGCRALKYRDKRGAWAIALLDPPKTSTVSSHSLFSILDLFFWCTCHHSIRVTWRNMVWLWNDSTSIHTKMCEKRGLVHDYSYVQYSYIRGDKNTNRKLTRRRHPLIITLLPITSQKVRYWNT